MKYLIEIINFAYQQRVDSKQGLITYEDDSESHHQDGRQVGREEAYEAVIKKCAEMIVDMMVERT